MSSLIKYMFCLCFSFSVCINGINAQSMTQIKMESEKIIRLCETFKFKQRDVNICFVGCDEVKDKMSDMLKGDYADTQNNYNLSTLESLAYFDSEHPAEIWVLGAARYRWIAELNWRIPKSKQLIIISLSSGHCDRGAVFCLEYKNKKMNIQFCEDCLKKRNITYHYQNIQKIITEK